MKKRFKENWKQHLARDTIALGGLTFYFLVIARALIAPYLTFTYQLLIALISLTILSLIIKDSENNIARITIAAFFAIMFYNKQGFTIMAIMVYIATIISAIYLQKTKLEITKGIILGIISVAIGYYGVILLGL